VRTLRQGIGTDLALSDCMATSLPVEIPLLTTWKAWLIWAKATAVRQALLETQGDVRAGAKRLGLSERQFWRYIKALGIDPDTYRPEDQRTGRVIGKAKSA
jgi:transcriptional regulator of acetoin/glycerol metabolism